MIHPFFLAAVCIIDASKLILPQSTKYVNTTFIDLNVQGHPPTKGSSDHFTAPPQQKKWILHIVSRGRCTVTDIESATASSATVDDEPVEPSPVVADDLVIKTFEYIPEEAMAYDTYSSSRIHYLPRF